MILKIKMNKTFKAINNKVIRWFFWWGWI